MTLTISTADAKSFLSTSRKRRRRGRPVELVSQAHLALILRSPKLRQKWVGVVFRGSDGELRERAAMVGCRKGIKGTGAAYSFDDAGNVPYWDRDAAGWRSLKVDRLVSVRAFGKEYVSREQVGAL